MTVVLDDAFQCQQWNTRAPITETNEVIERVAGAIETACCHGREGPFGGYDYGFDGKTVMGGRFVIRDFRDPKSPDWGKWLFQTDDREEYEALLVKMTRDHVARAALSALSQA